MTTQKSRTTLAKASSRAGKKIAGKKAAGKKAAGKKAASKKAAGKNQVAKAAGKNQVAKASKRKPGQKTSQKTSQKPNKKLGRGGGGSISKALKKGVSTINAKRRSTKKRVDDFLLKVGPSVSVQIQKLSARIDAGVSRVEDVKNIGLQILKRAQSVSDTLKKGRKKGRS